MRQFFSRFCHANTVTAAALASHRLHWISTLGLAFTIILLTWTNLAAGDEMVIDLSAPDVRQEMVRRLADRSRRRKAAALLTARTHGWAAKDQINGTLFELMAIEGDRVYGYQTCNVNSAISIAADLIRNTPPCDVNGAGFTVGIWDGGAARPSHQEFEGRIDIIDGAALASHSTHVAGTIAAAGIVPPALGMAPRTVIHAYEWNDDISEMTQRAMSYPNEPAKIQLSSHSYGYVCGWYNNVSPPRWYGFWSDDESEYFGQYDNEVAQWDSICYNAPYFLPFKAAGNDRDDHAPADGALFQYYKHPRWRTKTYNSSKDPYDDGFDNGGFDTIMLLGSAKNIMTVGAVYDAVSNGIRNLDNAAMTSFSGWGPTDDGRIKPDIVANGIGLYSPTAASDTSYGSYSGTSMSTPSAAGAAVLLLHYYNKLFPPHTIRAATLKALIIHTADDLGNPGPDYTFGWGIINAKAAAHHITAHHFCPDADMIVEGLLDDTNTTDTYTFEPGPDSPIRATLCWTDPPATALVDLDNPSPRLINDLDLRIIGPDGSTTYYPYVLNPASPGEPAGTGDNYRDNIEQVYIASPNSPGPYTVQVSHKAALTNAQQHYSLILSARSWQQFLLADFSCDGLVNPADLAILADYWLANQPSVDIAPEPGDGVINSLDFAELARQWTQ